MKRQVFYSFHYELDNWRASQVRNIGAIEGNKPVSDNKWEEIKRGGDSAIKKWINSQMQNRSCTVVLVGSDTANRKWINYEILKSWNDKMGIAGIYIHGLQNQKGYICSKQGANPFNDIGYNSNQRLYKMVKCHNPQGSNSKEKYRWIKNNLSDIVEEAIEIRNQY